MRKSSASRARIVPSVVAGDRRLAVLFAECDGYSALCQDLSPAEVHEHLASLYAIFSAAITGNGGTVDKFMGDGVMALFAGKSDRDSAASALAAGRTLLREIHGASSRKLRPTTVRIGIHLGDVHVGELGPSVTAVGHAVNVAARLTAHAAVADTHLVISGDAVSAIGAPPADLASLGRITLKGVRRPLTAWRYIPAIEPA